MPTYTVRIARSTEELDALLPFWEAHAERLESHPAYFRLVLGLRDTIEGPYVFVVEADGAPVTLMLCRLEAVEVPARFAYYRVFNHRVKSLSAVYNGLVGEVTPQTAALLAQAMQDALGQGIADVLTFRGLRDGALLEAAVADLNIPAWRRVTGTPDTHRVLDLPEDYQDVLGMRSSSNRKRLRRYARRIEEIEGFRLEVIDTADDLERMMADIEVVAARTYQRGLKSGFYNNAEWESLLRLGFERGWFTMWVVYGDGKPLTYAGGYSYNNVFYSYLKGYDPDYTSYSIGTYLLLKMIEDLIDRKQVKSVDYGFGDAPYKQLFSNGDWQERHYMLFGAKPRSALTALSVKTIGGASAKAQTLAHRWGLEARIKKILRRQKTDTGGEG